MELNSEDTKMIQGLSVLAMICLHLFDRIEINGLYRPLIYVGGVPFVYCLAQLSDFCVMGFAFCTGYGHMALERQPDFYKKRLKSLVSLLINYWIILILFSFIGIFIKQGTVIPGSMKEFIYNFFLLENSYNGAWWYMFTYVILVVVSPVLLKVVRKYKTAIIIVTGFMIYFFSYYLRFKVDTDNWLLIKIGPLGMTFFEYLLGMVVCKCKVFTYMYKEVEKLKKNLRIFLATFFLIGILVGHSFVVRSVFIAPFTGLIIIFIFGLWSKPRIIRRFFLFIGGHSTNIWLTHMFFYSKLFKDFVFVAKYPLFIYILMLLITILVSIIIQMICKPVQSRVFC